MTKRNSLLVSLLLVCGLAATASSVFAQGTTWSITANTNYYMRNEGNAEGVGTITLTTTSQGTIKAGSVFDINYNAPIAFNSSGYAVGVYPAGDFGSALGSAITVSVITPAGGFDSQPYYGPYASPLTKNEVQILFNSDVAFGPPTIGTTLSIAVRVMVQDYPYEFETAASVRALYNFATYPATLSPAYKNAFVVGEIGPTQALTLSFKEGPAHVLTCIGAKDINYFDNDFSIRVTENWPNALTSLSDEYVIENDTWAMEPTNGSNLLVTFTGIPPDVTLYEEGTYSCAEYPTGPHGCPGGALDVYYTSSGPLTCSGTPSTCTQWFHYTVDSTSTNVVENAVLKFAISSYGPIPPNMNYQINATVSLTDLEESNVPTDMPNFSEPEQPTDMPVVLFSDCVTKLLFPYVNTYIAGGTAFSKFGTGIDFANTTWDPWNPNFDTANLYADEHDGSAVPQSGSCAVYFYPANETATQVYTTPVISAGGSFAFDVGSSVPGFVGNTGYAIAICGFQNAYGFAEIYDNYGVGDPTATLGYLAYILPNPAFYHRSPAGDMLGEEAIAPYNINWFLQQILTYGLKGLY